MIDWEGALCREIGYPDLWFSNDPDDVADAISLCDKCPLKEQCLQFAKDNNEQHGIWGGVRAPMEAETVSKGLEDNRADIARSWYRSGMSLNDIARRLDVGLRAVKDYLGELHQVVPTEQRREAKRAKVAEAKEMHARGVRAVDIAHMMGVNPSTVSRYLVE